MKGGAAGRNGAVEGGNKCKENAMRVTHIVLGLALAAAAGLAAPAQAQDNIYIPLLTYRTGPFAGSGIPIANGMHDYLTMLNERDGGIGGGKLKNGEWENRLDNQKGVGCYEAVQGKKPGIIDPWLTRPPLQLITH